MNNKDQTTPSKKSVEPALERNYILRVCPPYWVLDRKQAAALSLGHICNCSRCLKYWDGKETEERKKHDNRERNVKDRTKKDNKIIPGQLWFLNKDLEGWGISPGNFKRFFKSPLVLILEVSEDWVTVGMVCVFSELRSSGDIILDKINAFVESWNTFSLPQEALGGYTGNDERDVADQVKRLQSRSDKTLPEGAQELFRFRSLELEVGYFFRKKAEQYE